MRPVTFGCAGLGKKLELVGEGEIGRDGLAHDLEPGRCVFGGGRTCGESNDRFFGLRLADLEVGGL